MLYLNKQLTKSSPLHKRWNAELWDARKAYHANEATVLGSIGKTMEANAAAQLPTDAWRQFDEQTQRVFRNDEGQGYLDRLLRLGRAVDIGKTVHLYRVASDAGIVTRSVGGEVPEILDKVQYDFEGDPVPIFKSGYGREWREWSAHQSENFDSLSDDNEATLSALRQDMAQYALDGDAGVVVQGYTGYGIRNHPNTNQIDLGAGGSNIVLTTATSDEIMTFFTTDFAGALDDNYIMQQVVLYVSPEIGRRLAEPYSQSGGFKEGTLREYLLRYGRIADIQVTFELSGNEAFAFVEDQRYIRTMIGAAVNTVAIPRQHPMARHQFLVWGAMGLQVKKDFNGRGGVFNLAAA